MRLRKLFLAVLLLVSGLVMAQEMQVPAIPVDPEVRIGKLDNGLTYYIRHNEWPEHKANFYIAQRVGSIQENDDQRGLAHFLEHMAFNGSEHFPDSTILEYTRSLGVEFGSNLNAYTSIDQTVYRICDVPTKRATAIDSCILILKDWSNGLTLAGKEIDKERGVIHQEWQLNEGPGQRMYQKILPRLYPGSKYGHRLPIGLMEIVDNFPHKALRDYYKKWYRPDNQAIIVVGDVDVDHVEAYIKKLWKGVKVPKNAAQVVPEPVADNPEAILIFEKDKEQRFSTVCIAMKHDAVDDNDKLTQDYLIDQYAKELIGMMFNQRLEEAVLKPDCPFAGAGSGDDTYILSKTKDAFQLMGMAKEGQDLEALAALYREALRVYKFGFTSTEFDRTKAEYMSQLEKRYTNRNKIKNSEFGDSYRDHYLSKEPIPSVEDEYNLMLQLAPMVTVDVINMYVKELISDKDANLVAFIMAQEKDGKTYPTEAEMAKTIQAVRQETLEPYVDNVKDEPLIAPEAMPTKGSITGEKENNVLGYKELTLSNGIKVILKKTDFKDDEIAFQGVKKGGKGLYGEADYSNLKLLDVAVNAVGLGNFTNNELQKALSGKQVAVTLSMDEYYNYIGGNSVPKDIETLMQMIYLHFTNLAKDEEAYNAIKSQLDLVLKNKHLTPESALSDSLMLTLYNRNPRFSALDVKDLEASSYDRMIEIAKEAYADAGEFVFYFIGNFDEATIRPLIEQYIASLPSKGETAGWKEVPYFVKGDVKNHFKRKMESPKAMAVEIWHMPMAYNLENYVLADAAGQVLDMVYLKDIREDASAAYSVSTSGSLSRKGDKAYGVIQAVCPMDPKKAETALQLLAKGIKDNTIKVDADKVAKIKENMLKNADADAKRNNHWINFIDEYVWTGVDLQTNYKKEVSALTPEKIAAYLKKMVETNNHVEVVMTPEE